MQSSEELPEIVCAKKPTLKFLSNQKTSKISPLNIHADQTRHSFWQTMPQFTCRPLFMPTPKGGWICPMSFPCLESQGCHLIPLYYLHSCSSANSHCSFCLVYFCPLAHSSDFFSPGNSSIFLARDRLFGIFQYFFCEEIGFLVWLLFSS